MPVGLCCMYVLFPFGWTGGLSFFVCSTGMCAILFSLLTGIDVLREFGMNGAGDAHLFGAPSRPFFLRFNFWESVISFYLVQFCLAYWIQDFSGFVFNTFWLVTLFSNTAYGSRSQWSLNMYILYTPRLLITMKVLLIEYSNVKAKFWWYETKK